MAPRSGATGYVTGASEVPGKPGEYLIHVLEGLLGEFDRLMGVHHTELAVRRAVDHAYFRHADAFIDTVALAARAIRFSSWSSDDLVLRMGLQMSHPHVFVQDGETTGE